MRDANVFSLTRCLPRMSWRPVNLWMIWNRSLGPGVAATKFTKSSKTLFQQRWVAKRFIRAYHGDWIAEKRFTRWFLPETLPDTRPATSSTALVQDYTGRTTHLEMQQRRSMADMRQAPTPLTSLMLIEVERRIDVFLFRCCFATSAWQARQLIVHGKVKLNGTKCANPNILLNPGDMVTVDPEAINMLRRIKIPAKEEPKAETEIETEAEASGEQTKAEPSTESTEPTADPEQPEELSWPEPETTTKPRSNLPQTFVDPKTKATVLTHRDTFFSLPPYASPLLFIPAYIEPSFITCSAVYVRHPTARPGYSEIPSPFEADGEVMRFAWEWYKKVRPRMRGRKERWINPSGERGNWKMVH